MLNVEWFRGRGGYEPFTENTLKSANVCVYLFVNTYTQNTPVQKRSVVHHLWPKKNKRTKKSISIHIFLLCFSYEFMVVLILWLWIFVHLINRTTRSWLVFRKQAASGKGARKGDLLPTSLRTPHYCISSVSRVILTRAGLKKNLHSMGTR